MTSVTAKAFSFAEQQARWLELSRVRLGVMNASSTPRSSPIDLTPKLVRDDVLAGRLCVAPIADPAIERVYVLAAQRGRPHSTAASLLARCVREMTSNLVKSDKWPDAELLLTGE